MQISSSILSSHLLTVLGYLFVTGVRLEPQGAVTTKGSKVRFACSTPQCVTANYPDTKFRMEHNGTAFGEVTKTHEYKNGYSLAFFEKHFNSPSDAGSYKCKVASNGQHQNETGVDVTFLHGESILRENYVLNCNRVV